MRDIKTYFSILVDNLYKPVDYCDIDIENHIDDIYCILYYLRENLNDFEKQFDKIVEKQQTE